MPASRALPQPTSTAVSAGGRTWLAIDLPRFVAAAGGELARMPYVTRVLLENLLRSRVRGRPVADEEIALLLHAADNVGADLPLYVSRVILPDSSGVPVLQDLAALRSAVARAGGDPRSVDTRVPVDLVVDHSLQVDNWGSADAMKLNMRREFERNAERYAFIGWAQQAFRGLRVFPPGSGIIHQVNLERIATVVATEQDWAFPDFVIGGDSHTPMINGIGVLGWGVGGIDAEAALLGHAYTFPLPEVVGVKLVGTPAPLVWTTDIALLVTERLRREKVANCAVEYFGPAALALGVPERATLANMAPEYGATCGFFAVDARTLDYLRTTGRSPAQVELVEAYCRRVGLFREAGDPDPVFSRVIEIDLGEARASMAGPQRPQDRLALDAIAPDFDRRLQAPMPSGGFGATEAAVPAGAKLPQGAVVIAAITSCTNTSNPQVMFAAGLVARNAVARGMKVPSWVKTSLAPGSPAVVRYLEAAGLRAPLAQLGFELIGFGCTTCAGKSGPLPPEIAQEIEQRQLVATAVLSGNRNFTGRIHKLVRANYIGAPPFVVGYALAGRIGINLEQDPIGKDAEGRDVFWRELLPDAAELQALVERAGELSGFDQPQAQQSEFVDPDWCRSAATGTLYPWDPESQYLREPPFFAGTPGEGDGITQLAGALRATRVLAAFGDSLTTDHISPSGEIPADIPSGQYLLAAGVAQKDFNTYVGRRGNFEVMVRGTFANVRIRNALVPEREGGWTLHFPDRQLTTIYDAAQDYTRAGTATIVLGGKEYGTGSSRDWAAKGSALLGVKAVIAESYERIHRANLIGMGVLPLRFQEGEGWRQLGLDGSELFAFEGVREGVLQGTPIRVQAQRADGRTVAFEVQAETRTAAERALIAAGGLPQSVLQDLLQKAPACA
ncbi:aconitate hydratase AcnA [Ramlibacter sp. G-1-2-2]|uniref:Aconitate hydratase n=1 Tax=Ramlibacter agri TaxID=2728837 RepID=A0A848HIM1_9BURK|nr:aconitate hydratase AcnA [Ramlibacter agri]NML47568.1 aconitate hydratase AcnA [Ramlibacter agri]